MWRTEMFRGLAKAKAPNPDYHEISIYDIITTSYMTHELTSTVRARSLRERRARGVVMVAPVEEAEAGATSAETTAGRGWSHRTGVKMQDTYAPPSFAMAKAPKDKRRKNKK